MVISIYKIDESYVYFHSRYGDLFGIWSDNSVPKMKSYYIELDIDEVITKKSISFNNHTDKIIIDNNVFQITGELISCEDCVLTLKLGEDLLMVNTNDEAFFNNYLGRMITFSAKQLYIYDIKVI